jgi:hypothetical protein
MVVDSDKRLAVASLSGDPPLSSATVDRPLSMLFPDHARDLILGQFPLSSTHLCMSCPNEPLNPECRWLS